MTNHETLDTFIFTVPDGSVLIVPIVKPYDHDELLERVASKPPWSQVWLTTAKM